MKIFDKYGIMQIGYYVESIEETAQLFADLFGAGPFVDMGVNVPESCRVRGKEQPVRTRCALGYLGDMQIELIEVESDCPDPYRESGGFGWHHVCIWVDDVSAAVEEFERYGMDVAMDLTSSAGMPVAYVDARKQLGHYIEVNPPLDKLSGAISALHKAGDLSRSLIGMQDLAGMMGR